MVLHQIPDLPWEVVSIDLFIENNINNLVIAEHYSDFWELEL